MAIDMNEKVRVWGGFSTEEFWIGAGVLLFLGVIALKVSLLFSSAVGGLCFFITGGGFAGIMLYQRDLPAGYLKLRFLQEGRFLFIHIPWVKGVDVYAAPSRERGRRFREVFDEDSNAG